MDSVPLGKRDLWFSAEGKPRGVIVITHGLNLHPARMDDLARAFAQSGFEVFRAAFFGHVEENGDFLRVDPRHWEEDAGRFHAIGAARARELGVPLHLVAYSFSALIFQTQRSAFHRRVYFAPALKFPFWYPLGTSLLPLLPDLHFRSRIPASYAANEKSGIRPLKALHHFRRRWGRLGESADKTPTLILCSPRDELVHGEKLRRLAQGVWEFREVSVEGGTLPVKYEHLVIDRAALGEKEFARVVGEAVGFLGG